MLQFEEGKGAAAGFREDGFRICRLEQKFLAR